MEPSAASAQDADLMDIDIDMDLDDHDIPIDEEYQLEEGEEPSFVPTGATATQDSTNIIPAIYTEDPALEPQWNKVHIRGVDEMHTNDILAFVHDHFSEVGEDVHVQWIDDTSANICFRDNATAKKAHLAFLANPITVDQLTNEPFELRTAKPLASRPASMLVVRVAQQGDRKRKGARDASRYYLLHPDQDPTERMRREFANSRTSRPENGDYRRRRFDDRELHRRRRDHDRNDEGTDFSANMYDDAPATATEKEQTARGRDLFSRVSKGRRRSASPGRPRTRNSDEIDISGSEDEGRVRRRGSAYRDRSDRGPRTNSGKELFSSTPDRKGSSGLHSDRIELFPSKAATVDASMNIDQTDNAAPKATTDPSNARANVAAAKRLKADLLSAAQTSPRSHRRSHAMDAKNEEDLAERFARKSISIDSTKSFKNGMANNGIELFPSSGHSSGAGLNIKGAAKDKDGAGFSIKGSGGFSIKGRAGVKELFPNQYDKGGRNEGKELFDEPVREKRIRRRAGDLFD
ncbi:hypothetical protein HRR83_004505 [Exophiala dermatitidis]|uniref:Uncharacterized protein n=2 Tax=Exophiala dermatitidis TaxID=5970 RepID=H6BQU9_EXODN|nr:uncharacterized protein HMPREF1120_02042 [Exophiala dermatitidis NIH/UT8656]KAJ4519471.1 hypothetical protein HRR74_004215 [Exophiala dermatitidis]EHY53862.1 hypothetical protein HMPREF1120_02042 [Exophiala dermatitidis NIH/UT8656]KAJ4529287.1 hypothetical protein HRR73_000310 [Exophiala dermatitidis]KAJ4582664.1 hypothetical protein HRR81_001393 [Exophiala dermatitidis]KAJ4597077.1 hypothetical protein HRR83_004505 [Exophiala dermatitidis]